jgi:hypothetical protein
MVSYKTEFPINSTNNFIASGSPVFSFYFPKKIHLKDRYHEKNLYCNKTASKLSPIAILLSITGNEPIDIITSLSDSSPKFL